MHLPSPMAMLVIAVAMLVLFGRGKVSSMMGEVGKGISAFKAGLADTTPDTAHKAEDSHPARHISPKE